MKNYLKEMVVVHVVVTSKRHQKLKDLAHQVRPVFVLAFPCRGTVSNELLNSFGIRDNHHMYLKILCSKEDGLRYFDLLKSEADFDRPGSGIAFMTSMDEFLISDFHIKSKEGDLGMIKNVLLTAVVNYGDSNTIIDAARDQGAYGATIIKGHGTVDEKVGKFFGFSIEPEKEVVIFIVKEDQASGIMKAIYEAGDFSKPGKGIVYAQTVADTYGISGGNN